MLIDPITRRTASNLGLNFHNVSANFNGKLPNHLQRRIHLNPSDGVSLTQTPAKLFAALASKDFDLPLPLFAEASKFMDGSSLRPFDLENTFGHVETWAETPLRYRDEVGEILLHDFADVIGNTDRYNPRTGLFLQSNIPTIHQKVGHVRSIPNASRQLLRSETRAIDNGVLFCNVHNPAFARAIKVAETALESIGLDYGTVTFVYHEREPSFQILNITTRLAVEDVDILKAYLQLITRK